MVYLHVPFHVITVGDVGYDWFQSSSIKRDQSLSGTAKLQNCCALYQRFLLRDFGHAADPQISRCAREKNP